MNVKEWTGDRQKSLGAVLILSGAISAAIIVIALAAAFWTFYSWSLTWWLKRRIVNRLLGRSGQIQTRIGQGLVADSIRSSDLEKQASGPPGLGTASKPLARWSSFLHH